MTRVFTEEGESVPVTVVEVDRERMERRRAGALVDGHVGHGPPLLQQKRGARQVIDERPGHRPPTEVGPDVRTRVVRVAGEPGS